MKESKKDSIRYKILLTGGEGFIGKHLQKRIDCHVYDLVNGDDIRDKFKLDRLFESEGFDCVINLAARAGVRRGEDFPEEYFSTNVLGLINLIDLSQKYGVRKFIHFSSSSVYGKTSSSATLEHEPKVPKSVYGITKLAGELLLENSKLPYVIVRPFTVIGENGRKEMVIYKWINQIKRGQPVTFYGKGFTSRGYTYVGDIVDGVKKILESDVERNDFNIGGHQSVTLGELWDIFKELFPNAEKKELPIPECDQAYSLADSTKTELYLNWKHKTDIKNKIREIIKKEL